ncbi:hypothetical protein ACBI99_44760 [Nonomuraea sp. ATR24]|uniref:hypothetical protein n=1 Tax=Nonomuraea sp. ATR24 TaxID=1676744 RepID=UPI0035C26104
MVQQLRRVLGAVDAVDVLVGWAILAITVGLALVYGIGVALVAHGGLLLALVVAVEVAAVRRTAAAEQRSR